MKNMLYDFLPVLLFFIAFKIYGIYVATVVGIAATAIQVLLTYVLKRKVDKQQLITLAVFVIFGSMTLYFHNPLFIKWKPTVIFWIFGLAFLFSRYIGKKPLIQRMLEGLLEQQAATVPLSLWQKLNFAWAIFFIFLGSINIYVAYTYSTETWVNFKVFGILGLLIAFSFFQAAYLSKHLSETK
ncbi:MAG: septation protein A [Gammaproteobacteria bacterium]|nr:septation protein A [Gammaproteobacteria bacterium]